jgi:hypothetical protein
MNEEKIGSTIGNHYNFQETISVPGLISPNHNVGIEVEIENCHYNFYDEGSPRTVKIDRFYKADDLSILPSLDDHWLIVKDGSLRKGCEFIFDSPKKGQDIIDALFILDEFFNVYRSGGDTVECSNRTSIHCHLDVRDLSSNELNNLLMLYVLFERVLFLYVDPSRLKNNYCRPVTDSSFKHTLIDIKSRCLKHPLKDTLKAVQIKCDKYSALNLLPLNTFGTVEFRHHQGTSNLIGEVLDWINIILSFKLLSSRDILSVNELYSIMGYKHVLRTLFAGTKLSNPEFVNRFDVETAMHKGMTDIKEILFINELRELSSNPSEYGLKCNLKKVFLKNNLMNEPKPRRIVNREKIDMIELETTMAGDSNTANTANSINPDFTWLFGMNTPINVSLVEDYPEPTGETE